MTDLLALAERFVALSAEIEDVRRAMLARLTNGAGETSEGPFRPSPVKAGREGAAAPPGGEGGRGGGPDCRSAPEPPRSFDPRGRDGDGGFGDDHDGSAQADEGAGRSRGRRRRRLDGPARMTPEERAELLAPGPAVQCSPWVRAISQYPT